MLQRLCTMLRRNGTTSTASPAVDISTIDPDIDTIYRVVRTYDVTEPITCETETREYIDSTHIDRRSAVARLVELNIPNARIDAVPI